jgi:hypothetical protein
MIINNDVFKVKEIPDLHPELEYYERITFWGEQKRYCIEGKWSSGKWMPGPLYYYVNFHNILFEDDTSVAQAVGLPWLRDIDWELFLLYEECRGFSGFSGDKEFTCDRKYGPEKDLSIRLGRITEKEASSIRIQPSTLLVSSLVGEVSHTRHQALLPITFYLMGLQTMMYT